MAPMSVLCLAMVFIPICEVESLAGEEGVDQSGGSELLELLLSAAVAEECYDGHYDCEGEEPDEHSHSEVEVGCEDPEAPAEHCAKGPAHSQEAELASVALQGRILALDSELVGPAGSAPEALDFPSWKMARRGIPARWLLGECSLVFERFCHLPSAFLPG